MGNEGLLNLNMSPLQRYMGAGAGAAVLALSLSGCGMLKTGVTPPDQGAESPPASQGPEVPAPATVTVTAKAPVAPQQSYIDVITQDAQWHFGESGSLVKEFKADLVIAHCLGASANTSDVLDTAAWAAVGKVQINTGVPRPGNQTSTVGPKTAAATKQLVAIKSPNCGAPAQAAPVPNSVFTKNSGAINKQPAVETGIPGCGKTPGPPSLGTFCPDGSSPYPDKKLPLGCPGSALVGPVVLKVYCPAGPGRPAGYYIGHTRVG